MPFHNTSFATFLLVSYFTGITSTVDDYAEQVVHVLADVAHMRQFDLAIRSSSPNWYREGMQLFAWNTNGFRWAKKVIPWAIKKDSTHVPREFVEQVFIEAFGKWRTVLPKIFARVPHYPQGGIRISFESDWTATAESSIEFPSKLPVLDVFGIDIVFNDNVNWTDKDGEDYRNFRFAALHEIGHVLGLADSNIPYAVMSNTRRGFTTKVNPILHPDDIEGVQSIYGPREG